MGSRWPPPRDDGYRQGNRSEAYRSSYSSTPQFPPYQGGGDSRNGGGDRYNFRSDRRHPDSYRDDARNSARGSDRDFRPPQGDFTFRTDRPSGVQESYESFRGSSQRNGNDSYRPGPSRRNHGNGPGGYNRGGPRGSSMRNGRGGFIPRRRERAADRLFLHKKHDDDAEDLLGDTSLRATYLNPDDLSESDDAAMDISGESEVEDENEPAAKRVRLDNDDSVPKWSNPDPYTALPPPDETQRKKKDVVQMIRKARVEAEEKKQSGDTEAAEFISFDFSDEEDDVASVKESEQDIRVLNAPTGPRSSLPMTLPSGLPPRPPENLVPPTQPAAAKSTPARPAPIVDLSASTNLGSRKRTVDDKIKERPHQPLQKGKKMKADATVESVWKPTKDEDACPWAVIDHSSEPNMGVRLHKELVDFFEYVRPRDFEEAVRQDLVHNLSKHAKRWQRSANVKPFGSFMSGLYLPTADMDLVICSDNYMNGGAPVLSAKSALFKLRAYLTKNDLAHGNDVEVISGAKVPLVKYIDEATGLRVDISFENLTGIQAIDTFMEWKRQYPAMPILVAIIKHFLCMRGLNEPVNGGIGGFSVICMVVNLLNHWPEVQSGTLIPEHHLGEALMRFFRLYGKEFDYESTAISMNPPRFVPKHSVSKLVYRNMDRLSIIDPNNSANDISGGSSNFPLISRCFRTAYDELQKRMYALAKGSEAVHGHDTILAPILGGNYKTFRVQRAYLKSIYDSKHLGAQAGQRRAP
ncbi:hypothetical protein PFICI_09994 [Pestalotiopsis fici W106-1]|uniref:polynucleotide adenylyltransferase n=1 Tax=Pestalotiopsis fici (strain W106-1 / CGMCC3.15140) TaxID=1229662 RepID=W3WXS1_PESFW|nr:uncharacterized protein PFICI_09994 [Pestalotiopsis fici W106-1]ETS77932.1 hypothetical protein PFICI_09994 [Pestalotiopsis fici W106-1]